MRRTAVSTAAAITLAAATLTATGAHASYPGANGRLAFGLSATATGQSDIYSILPNGRGLRQLTTYDGQDACATYSPDGHAIAWCTTRGNTHGGADIWVMKQNGTDQRRVTDLGGNVTFPDFAPAGDSIVFAGRPAGFTNPDIWTIGLDGTGLTKLTTSTAMDQFPVYSPDGTRIAFRSNRTGTFQVWVMNADGTDQHALTIDASPKDQVPEWSPDGSRIAYAASSPETGLDIWVMNADGSDQHPVLADGGATFGPAWSPDGTRIAYLDATDNAIETIDAQGGDVRVLFSGGLPAVPAWQPRVDDEE
jgi:Tol biopolymer transport system component